MRVVYCIDSLKSSGGTERVLTTKVNWLCQQPEIDIYIISLIEDAVPFFPLDGKVKRVFLYPEEYQEQLDNALRKIKPDVTVGVAGRSCTLLPKMEDGSAKILEFHYTKNFLVNFVRALHHIRFRQIHLLKMRWMQWKLARLAKRYDCFVGLTARDVELWGKPSNMTYVYNPLSFRSERKSTCLNHKIIAVGSITPVKGMDQLVKAFGLIAERYPDWSVDIYGNGQERDYLERLIEENKVQSQITVFDPVSDIGDRLVEASIYAFPSRSDGFGLVITEAMECGLPTVAMNCPCGPFEILSDCSGIIVPHMDIEAFARALAKLMDDEALRIKMGQAAQREVSRFYPDAIMPQWLKIFQELKQ